MDINELKKIRHQNFIDHKKKKRDYYLKSKGNKKKSYKNPINLSKSIDFDNDLNNENFLNTIKKIAKAQKNHIDLRKDLIKEKIKEYKNNKKSYYEKNKEKRLNYNKVYREEKKEKLKQYRKDYYQKNKEKLLEQQRKRRLIKKLEREKNEH